MGQRLIICHIIFAPDSTTLNAEAAVPGSTPACVTIILLRVRAIVQYCTLYKVGTLTMLLSLWLGTIGPISH